MPSLEDQAVCIRVWDWSETSQTAVLLTKDHGMIRVLAKGSKRERSAFSGGLETCTLGQMGVIVKPSSELGLLTHWDLLDPMLGVRKNLASFRVGMLAIDLIPRLIQGHDPHPEIFDALYELLTRCSQGGYADSQIDQDSIHKVLAWFMWIALVEVGAMPITDHDVRTGDALVSASVYGFSSALGGITQDPITHDPQLYSTAQGNHKEDAEVWRVREQTVVFMRTLGESPDINQFLDESDDQCHRLARLLASYIRERTGTEIPTIKWLLDNNKLISNR